MPRRTSRFLPPSVTNWRRLMVLMLNLLTAGSGVALSGCRSLINHSPGILPGGRVEVVKPRSTSRHIGWDSNIKVLASSPQDYVSYLDNKVGFIYTYYLLNTLQNREEVVGLEDAHVLMERLGYPANGRLIHPTSTPRNQGSWQKSDTERQRFVLLLGEKPAKDEFFTNAVDFSLTLMEAFLKQEYNVSDDDIMRQDNASNKQVREGIQWLATRLRENPDAEVLIYYAGHGHYQGHIASTDMEGDAQGLLGGSKTREKQLKSWVNRELGKKSGINREDGSQPPVLMIFDTCYSGSFIAKNDVENPSSQEEGNEAVSGRYRSVLV